MKAINMKAIKTSFLSNEIKRRYFYRNPSNTAWNGIRLEYLQGNGTGN